MILFTLDTLIDLFAVNRDIFGCIHTDSDLITLHAQHGHRNLVADHDGLADSPSQYQHNPAPCQLGTRSGKNYRAAHRFASSIRSPIERWFCYFPQEFFGRWGKNTRIPNPIVTTSCQNNTIVQLESRLRTSDSTPSSAAPKFSGCVPPA